MKTWHYNIAKILKDEAFCQCLVECLTHLEGDKDHKIVLSMLHNYFNLRNKGFGSNWINLPSSRVSLYVDTRGIYFRPESNCVKYTKEEINSLNQLIYSSIGLKSWILTFTKSKTIEVV